MIGDLTISRNTYPSVRLNDADGNKCAVLQANTESKQVSLYTYPQDNSGYTEGFRFPLANDGLTSSKYYEILTTKDPASARTAIGAAPATHNHAASSITSGVLPLERGGTGLTFANLPPYAILRATSDLEEHPYLYWTATGNGAFYATSENGAAKFGTLPILQGGTGSSTGLSGAPNNAIITRLKSETSDQLYYKATKSGAFYATTDNGAAQFGTLPIAQGGTGAVTANDARIAIGAIGMDLLWENSSKTSSFSEQTITLGSSLSNYSAYIVMAYFMSSTDSENHIPSITSVISKTGRGCRLYQVAAKSDQYYEMRRTVDYNSGQLKIYDAYRNGSVMNEYLVPVYIYGIKGVKTL